MSEELKPCPFCGSDKIHDAYIRDGRSIHCGRCSANVSAYHGRSDQPSASERAAALWNTRASAPEMAEALEGAIKALELAVRAATASAGFTGAEMDEILAEHVALKPARAALAKARGQ